MGASIFQQPGNDGDEHEDVVARGAWTYITWVVANQHIIDFTATAGWLCTSVVVVHLPGKEGCFWQKNTSMVLVIYRSSCRIILRSIHLAKMKCSLFKFPNLNRRLHATPSWFQWQRGEVLSSAIWVASPSPLWNAHSTNTTAIVPGSRDHGP